MLEKETERLLEIVREQTIGRGEAIAVKDVLAAEIPYPLKVFFRADVERVLREEQRRTIEQSRFNYHHREVESLMHQVNSILVVNFMFLREEFLQKLEDGVHLILNYLLRPQWTLTNFLFNASPSMATAELKTMFAYFGAYEYLKEVFFRYVDEKRVESLRSTEFQHLIRRIDAEYLRRKSGLEIARLTTPIYDFLHFTPFSTAPTSSTPLGTKIFVKFFEDKHFPLLARSLEQYCAQQNLGGLTLEQLQIVLDATCRSHPDALQLQEPSAEPSPEVEKESPSTATSEPRVASRAETPHGPPVLPAVSVKPLNLQNLHECISDEERRRFLKKIFKKDEAYYRSSIDALNGIPSWKEASQYIDKIFISNDVDPYSGEAMRFSEIVRQRYFPKPSRR